MPCWWRCRLSRCSWRWRCDVADDAEADMVRGEVILLRLARGGAIARAEVGRAQPATALDDHVRVVRRAIGPFPDIADQVVHPVAISGKAAGRGRARKAVLALIPDRKNPLPVVGAGHALVVDRAGKAVCGIGQTAARRT